MVTQSFVTLCGNLICPQEAWKDKSAAKQRNCKNEDGTPGDAKYNGKEDGFDNTDNCCTKGDFYDFFNNKRMI